MNTTLEQLTNLGSIKPALQKVSILLKHTLQEVPNTVFITNKGYLYKPFQDSFSGRRSKYSIYLHTGVLQVCVLVIIPNHQDILTYLNWTYELSATFVAAWSISICLFLRHLEIMLGLSTTADQLWKKKLCFQQV